MRESGYTLILAKAGVVTEKVVEAYSKMFPHALICVKRDTPLRSALLFCEDFRLDAISGEQKCVLVWPASKNKDMPSMTLDPLVLAEEAWYESNGELINIKNRYGSRMPFIPLWSPQEHYQE